MTESIDFRVPAELPAPRLDALLSRAWPGADERVIEALFEEDRVRLDERVCRDAARIAAPGSRVRVTADGAVGEPASEYGMPAAEELERGEDWIIVDKPIGMPGRLDRTDDPLHPIYFLADLMGLDRATFRPVWELPDSMGGPWLCAHTPQVAGRLAAQLREGTLHTVWIALVERPGAARGTFDGEDVSLEYAVTRQRDRISEVQLAAHFSGDGDDFAPVESILDALAAAGHPALGDDARGGYLCAGGLRLRLHVLHDDEMSLAASWPAPRDWIPEAPVVAPEPEPEPDQVAGEPAEETSGGKTIVDLEVSRQTLHILSERGHPWVLRDRDTGPTKHLGPGTMVRLVDRDGRRGPFALLDEPDGQLVARRWSTYLEEARDFHDEVDLRVDEALVRREDLVAQSARTDIFRLIHGEADGLPGLHLDRLGPLLRATLTGRCAESFAARVWRNMLDAEPGALILAIDHFRDVRSAEGELPRARVVSREHGFVRPGARVQVREDDLRYWIEPWEGIDVGFFADQRDNRRRLDELASPGDRWLNLFCHTGAFSVRLAARGAHVTSVDLSARYLRWLEDNLALNGLSAEHHTSMELDARRAVRQLDGPFDGIIVDPPTAASGPGGFWSVRRDFSELLERCLELLAPSGAMLVCHNDRKRRGQLPEILEESAARAGRDILSVEDAPPAPDFPRLPGFPEGDSFEGAWLEVR
jgi:23S rRNA (cytosine1962-C5)-methyltransferase